MMVSVIIPTYNEISCLGRTLDGIEEARGDFEVLVADGESSDGTCELVRNRAGRFRQPLRVVSSPRPRALQLNHAVGVACGETLLFLHADMEVPQDAILSLEACLRSPSVVGGNFQIVFAGDSKMSKLFTWVYRVRRPFGIYYGDSGVFVRREAFKQMGGFRPIPIMDDYEFVRRLERAGRTVCLRPPLLVSDRLWRVQGVGKTLASWILLQTLYSLGVPAERLARWYVPIREN